MGSDDSIVKKSLIYFVGNFSSKLLGTLIIPIYAIYLTTEELGQYDFQQTIANFLAPIIVLAIWEAVLKFSMIKADYKQEEIFSTVIIFTVISSLVTFIILYAIYSYIYSLGTLPILYVLMIVLTPGVSVLQNSARGIGENILYAKCGIISSILNIFLLLMFVVFFKGGLIGILLSSILTSIFTISYIFFRGRFYKIVKIQNFNFNLLKEMISFSSPLILNLIFMWFLNGYSRVIINTQLGSNANGLYAFASKFANIISTIGIVINMAAIEDTFLSVESKDFGKKFEKNLNGIFSTLFILAIVFVPIVIVVFELFLTKNKFFDSVTIIPLLVCSTIFSMMSTSISNLFQAKNKTSVIFTTSIIGALSNIVLSMIFIKIMGIQGVVFSQVISGFFILISRYLLAKKILDFSIKWIRFISLFVSYCIVSLISLQMILKINFILIIIISLISVYFLRDSLTILYKKIKRE